MLCSKSVIFADPVFVVLFSLTLLFVVFVSESFGFFLKLHLEGDFFE